MPKICYISRRFGAEALQRIQQANAIISEYEGQGFNLTLRQCYYQMVARDIIPNTVKSYKNLGEILNDARLAGLVDWNAIEDRTRNLQKIGTWDSPVDIIRACADQYAEDWWKEQSTYCEVWVEKEALAGIVQSACDPYRVPHFACRGYVSQSEMWAAARRFEAVEQDGRQTHLIHLGDHDPSGIDMSRDIADRMRLFGSEVEVTRIALTRDQVDEYGPPPNPAKATDSRYADYQRLHGDESWELDALEPRVIMELIRQEIESHIEQEAWEASKAREAASQRKLEYVCTNWTKFTRNAK